MGHYRLKRAAQRLATLLVMLTVVITTLAPAWTQSVSAETTAPAASGAVTDQVPADAGDSPAHPVQDTAINTLILSQPGRVDALQEAIVEAGGTLVLRTGDALYVGLNNLSAEDLAPLGARAVYQEVVSDLTGLTVGDRSAVSVWNQLISGNTTTLVSNISSNDLDSTIVFPETDQLLRALPSGMDPTSLYMMGSVGIDVVFVESQGTSENWTQDEIDKIKGEVGNALNWWSVVATTPATPGGTPRPSAHLSWDIRYYTPMENAALVTVPMEPINMSINQGLGITSGWIPEVAQNFTNLPTDTQTQTGDALWTWANTARRFNDWGFVLFIVDSSEDPDGRFAVDGKTGGAALNGPWAVVTSTGGDLGLNNLEILIAKMTGHIFGAGDEAYNVAMDTGCHIDEFYGYLRVGNINCENPINPNFLAPSLMRSTAQMIAAYQNYQLSDAARGMLGWIDSDHDGIYNVADTLGYTFPSIMDQICPVLDLVNVPLTKVGARPTTLGAGDNYSDWSIRVWNRNTATYANTLRFQPYAINWASFVWGRANSGAWVGATPTNGGTVWNDTTTGFDITLVGHPGSGNQVELVLLDRWNAEAFRPAPETFAAQAGVSSGTYQSDDPSVVSLTGMWQSILGVGIYSADSTMQANTIGSEACFSVSATELSIRYSELPTAATMNVVIDGKLHSTITYQATSPSTTAQHQIANLAPGNHTIQLVASTIGVTFDTFQITNNAVAQLIDAATADVTSTFYYENSGPKVLRMGDWTTVTNTSTPAFINTVRNGSYDNSAIRSSHPFDRVYAYFTHADTVAIYRSIFPNAGTADVYVDGTLFATMNNNATVRQVAPYYLSGFDLNVTHSIEIRLNPAATGAPVSSLDFDAFRFYRLGTTHNNLVSIATLQGGPVNVEYPNADEIYGVYLNYPTFQQTLNEGDTTVFFFQGSAVAVRRMTAANFAKMELYIDGELRRTVDNNAPGAINTPVFIQGLDPNKPHVLQVRMVRRNSVVASYNRIFGYTVYNIAPVNPGTYEEYHYNPSVPTQTTYSDFIYEELWNAPYYVTAVGGPSGQHFITSRSPSSRAYLYFTGANTIAIYGVLGVYTYMDIYINNELRGSFYQRAATAYGRSFVVSDIDPNITNVLELRVRTVPGMVPIMSLDKVVIYDAPILAPGTYENDEIVLWNGINVPALQFSGQWLRQVNASTHTSVVNPSLPKTQDLVMSALDNVVFDVSGASSVVLYRRLYGTYGRALVYVDGQYYTSFNNGGYGAYTWYQKPFTIGGLNPAVAHRIQIVPLTSGAVFHRFDIDYIVVRATDTAGSTYLAEGFYENDNATAMSGGAITYIGQSLRPSFATGTANSFSPTAALSTFPREQAVITFSGNAFTLYYNRLPNGGLFDVYMDGEFKARLNAVGPALYHLPYVVAGLKPGIHVAELITVTNISYVEYDGYRVDTYTADYAPTYNLIDEWPRMPDVKPDVLVSGEWAVSGSYLRTIRPGASLWIYVMGGETITITRNATALSSNLLIYINGQYNTAALGNYLPLLRTTDENWVISGLPQMRSEGYWIEIRVQTAYPVQIKQIQVSNLAEISMPIEAENTAVIRAGQWIQTTSVAFSGNAALRSVNAYSYLYIPVRNADFLTIYRSVGTYGNANIYVDGVLWGQMLNSSPITAHKVPFIVPLVNDSGIHIITIRAVSGAFFFIDSFNVDTPAPLSPGFYNDNNSELNAGFNVGTWRQVTAAGAFGNTVRQTIQVGARFTSSFTGNRLTVYRRMSLTNTSLMTVRIDGVSYMISNRSATVRQRVPYTILLPTSTVHTLEIINSGVGLLDVDAIEIGMTDPATVGAYQETDARVVYNDTFFWSSVSAPTTDSGGAHIQTWTVRANAFFLFNSQRLTIYFSKAINGGIVNIFIDGVSIGTVDMYSPTPVSLFPYEISGLTEGNHVLEIRYEGQRNVGVRTAPIVNFDVISVDGAPIPTPGGVITPQ